jgi:phage/plasmid-like protein (TIGR03299 family)
MTQNVNRDGLAPSDSLVLRARPAYHGIGTVVEELAPEEVLPATNADYTVRTVPGWADFRELPQTETRPRDAAGLPLLGAPADGHRYAIRTDTGETLGAVTDVYHTFQNRELVELTRDVRGPGGDPVTVETAGTLGGGRTFFLLLRTGAAGIGFGGADELTAYTLLSTSHDGKGALVAAPTAVRVVCRNFHETAIRGSKGRMTIRHTAALPRRVELLRSALAGHAETFRTYRETASRLALRPLTARTLGEYFAEVLAAVRGRSVAELFPGRPSTAAEERTLQASRDTLTAWTRRMEESPGCRVAGIGGTLWAALNAVTEESDHGGRIRRVGGEDESSARLRSRMTGSGARVKAAAHAVAVARLAP